MLRLLPFTARKPGGILRSAHSLLTSWLRVSSPSRDSILTTSAPSSAELVGAVRARPGSG